MSTQVQTEELVIFLTKDLSLSEEEAAGLQTDDQYRLQSQLERLIAYLLDRDFNRLLNACYRMDIAESSLKLALNTDDPKAVPSEIASLIISRQIQKIVMRKKYDV
ncbi:MAG: hypothetical protein AAFO69_21540 [Bacteroidota bacterium]